MRHKSCGDVALMSSYRRLIRTLAFSDAVPLLGGCQTTYCCHTAYTPKALPSILGPRRERAGTVWSSDCGLGHDAAM